MAMIRKSLYKIHINLVIALFLIGFQNQSLAQKTPFEKVFVHINRNVLLSGSELKYTAYVTNETDTEVSQIIYFELIDCQQISVLNWKTNTKNQRASGVKAIPESIPNGLYYLVAFTNKIHHYPSSALHTNPILIQRIFDEPLSSLCLMNKLPLHDSVSILAKNTPNYLKIEITDDSLVTILLKPEKKLQTGQFSISVTEISPFEDTSQYANFVEFTAHTNSILSNTNVTTSPIENTYSILSGRVCNLSDSAPLANIYIYLSYADSTLHFNYFKTNKKGEFCFLLDSSFNNKQLYLQTNPLHLNGENLTWFVDAKNLENFSNQEAKNLRLSEIEQEYLAQLQKREMVHRIYHTSTYETQIEEKGCFKNNFFQTPSYLIKPSDYVELHDFKDICDNILPSVRFRANNNKVQIGMVIDQQIVYENVLISINGLPCFNMNYIENLSSKEIKQIEIFNSVLMYGDLMFNGVIAIYTYNKEIDERAFSQAFYTFDNYYFSNKIANTVKQENLLPYVIPDIFWNENVSLYSSEPLAISFKKPEIGSRYRIAINGLINDTTPFGFSQHIRIDK